MSNGKRRKSGPGKGTKDDKAQRPDGPSPEGGANLETPQNTAEGGSAASTDTSSPQMARRTGIPVVGMGGSAGALDCFKAFFEAMPPDSGAAFVVIQHLAPGHVSMLPELLAQHTRMTVAQAQDGAEVEPNCVYIIPPNEYLDIRGGVLHLSEPVKQDGIRMPIDFFFRALAEDRQEQAICILFSGAGTDGTLGVRAVRGAGGLTIAQDPQTAQYGDMPRSAIATKLVDFVLGLDQMPKTILEYLRQPYVRGGRPEVLLEGGGKPAGFDEILATVQAQTGNDFRCYKKATILRRIERRMGLHRIQDIAQYCTLLHRDVGEVRQLHKDLLINVTAFFRDADAFEELRLKAIGPMIQAKTSEEALRVWVPGCSSGEEAYSLAMLLMDEMTAARKVYPLQVFATDIDQEALEFARQGIYPESIAADVGAERLARFFVRKEQGFQVSDSLRSLVVFAEQNLITDPPFSKMDVVSCRNLLIYLDTQTQEKLIPLFNFALNSGGYLFLGKSEGVGSQGDLFSVVSKKARIYRRHFPSRRIVLNTPILPGRKKAFPTAQMPIRPASYADAIRQALLGHFAAGVVLVDRKGQILQFHGQTGKYLNMPTGEPNLNLLDIAKEGLSVRLRSALHKAGDESRIIVLDQVPLTREEGSPFARVTVMPLTRRGEAEPLLAVIFEDLPRPATASAESASEAQGETTARQLEDELRATQQDLQSSIEELQSANEELRVSNEEVVSTNEELQSTNEELETSKEELQSINEELTTVNSQLQEKAERLAGANSDLSNLLKSTRIATLFLDTQLRVKFYTPDTERVLKVIRSDIGRPISDLSTQFIDYDLTADARAVAQGGAVVERDARHTDGSVYHVRIMPYLTQEDLAEGVVVTFDDVTRLRRAEERTRRLATVVMDSNDAVIMFGLEGAIHEWNRGATTMYGWSEEEALRMNIRDLAPADEAAAIGDLARRLLAGEAVASFEIQRRTKDGRTLDVWLTITAVRDESGKVASIATTERDITERIRAEEGIERRNAVLGGISRIFEMALQAPTEVELCEACLGVAQAVTDSRISFVAEIGPDGLLHDLAISDPGWDACKMVDQTGHRKPPGNFPIRGIIGRVLTDGKTLIVDDPSSHADWTVLPQGHPPLNSFLGVPLRRNGKTVGIIAVANRAGGYHAEDQQALEALAPVIVEALGRKRAESALQTTLQRFYVVLSSMYPDVLLVTDDGKVEFANQAFCDSFGLKEAPADMVGLGSSEVIEKIKDAYLHPDEAVARILEIVERGEPVHGEEIAMRDGRACLRDYVPVKVDGKSYGRMWVHIDITDRKRAEQEVLRAKEEWERTFDSVPDLIVILDDHHRVLRANRAMAEKLGVTPEQCVGLPCYKAVHGTDEPPNFCPHSQTLNDHQPHTVEVHEERLGGDFLVTTTPMFGPDGKTTGTVHVARDITERKRVEQAVRESESRFSGIVGSAMDAIVSVDADQRIMLFNAAAERVFGYRAQEVLGQPLVMLLPPDRREAHEGHVRDFAATGVTARQMGALGEVVGLRANGEQFPIEASISQTQVAGRKVLTVILRDITARKAAEDAMSRLATIVESSNEAIIAKDLAGTILTWNAGAERMLGYRAEEAVGQPISMILPLDRLDEEDDMLQRQRRGERVENVETVRLAKDGRRIDVLVSSSPLKDPQGRVIGASKIIHDISDRKRAQEALARAAQELERSNEDLRQFANIASHDLQEPLRMVSGFLKIVEQRYKPLLDDKGKEYIGFAVEGATRMSHLISDLLEYSRVERRGEPLQPTDARKALGAAMANLQRSIKNAGATVTQDDLPTVQADPTQLMQLFQNLVGNAIKYRSQDRPCQVHVGVQKKGNQWVFLVRDNGIGIAPEQFDRIFVIFQRLHTRDKYPGTGIGLAICKKIVERHAGKIWIDSKLGEGTTFYFTLPADSIA